jgi:uncharacterized membrane protein YagU involved in acid resistance
MNVLSLVLWGFVATLVLTTLLAASQGVGLTRMNLPYMLGTMVTPGRDRAKALGFGMHLVNGWIFALLYVAILRSLHVTSWWMGALLGLAHAVFVLVVAAPLLPAVHPRMASEQEGPTVRRQLEPPGFLALHYGMRTPLSIGVAHVLYGAIIAWRCG